MSKQGRIGGSFVKTGHKRHLLNTGITGLQLQPIPRTDY